MVRPGLASPIRRSSTSLAPLENVNVRELLLESPSFGPEQVENLRRAMSGDQLAVARQSFAELRDQAEVEKPERRALIVAGVLAYLLGQHQLASRYLSQVSGVGIADYYRASFCSAKRNMPKPRRRLKTPPRTVTTRFSAGSARPARSAFPAGWKMPKNCSRVGPRRGDAPNTRIRWAASAPITATFSVRSSISSGRSTWIRTTRRPCSASPTK